MNRRDTDNGEPAIQRGRAPLWASAIGIGAMVVWLVIIGAGLSGDPEDATEGKSSTVIQASVFSSTDIIEGGGVFSMRQQDGGWRVDGSCAQPTTTPARLIGGIGADVASQLSVLWRGDPDGSGVDLSTSSGFTARFRIENGKFSFSQGSDPAGAPEQWSDLPAGVGESPEIVFATEEGALIASSSDMELARLDGSTGGISGFALVATSDRPSWCRVEAVVSAQ